MFQNTFLLINQISVKKLPVQDMYIKYIACPAVFLVFCLTSYLRVLRSLSYPLSEIPLKSTLLLLCCCSRSFCRLTRQDSH